MNSISNLNLPIYGQSLAQPTEARPADGQVFKNLLRDSIEQVNTLQQDAQRAVEQLMSGGDVDPAEVLTAVQKADMTFRMMLQIRNKLIQAYQELQEIRI